VLSLLDEQQRLRKEMDGLIRELARQRFAAILEQTQTVGGVSVLAALVEAPNVETLREMCDWFREQIGSGVVVLGADMEGRPSLVAAVTSDLVDRGVHAGRLVKEVARMIGGGGGGRPTMAQAGGRDSERLPEALDTVGARVQSALAS
jgi:alanyl-tRNA synthetase